MPTYQPVKKAPKDARRHTAPQLTDLPQERLNDASQLLTFEPEMGDGAYQEQANEGVDSIESASACLLPKQEAPPSAKTTFPYVFTHELPAEALTQSVGVNKVLLAGSLIGAGKSPKNDVQKSHINPIFTRVLSIEKAGGMKGLTRAAFRPNLVGGQQPIVMLIAPSAATSDHQAVDNYIELQNRVKKAGWPKYPPVNNSAKTGLFKSYNKDVGKTGGTSLDELSPDKLAKSAKYNYANEQHWHRGIALENHLCAVVLKIGLGNDGKYGLVKSGQPQQVGDARIWDIGALLGFPGKASDQISVDDEVKRTIDWSTTVTTRVYAVTPNYPLENVIHILNKSYNGIRFENLPIELTQPQPTSEAPLATSPKRSTKPGAT
ncbi:hypothetical protein [Pseudomonas sp. NPDC086251]|uniref:hypothetical protein n=1 Tax=Pseudomonas sp. NPDC086251 TaxID=3364431 RepID=UPI003833FDE3